MNDIQIAQMIQMRRDGKSYGQISVAFGQKYPAWSRHYILRAGGEEMTTISARKHNPNRIVSLAVRAHTYDMEIQIRHGDGHQYGCGKFIGSTQLLDPQGPEKAKAIMADHRLHCNVLTKADKTEESTVKVRKAGEAIQMRRVAR